MTGMLASVTSVEEALLALQAQVDIIDLKQPAQGALGALDNATVRRIVQTIAGHCPVSATIGDLPMQPELVFNAVSTMAATGVDYIKIGIFPEGDSLATIAKLTALTGRNALIAVLFADCQPDMGLISVLKQAGFKGVMLDTLDKKRGSLLQVMAKTTIEAFVTQAKVEQLLCGLAGSLRSTDITGLLPFHPDYLGFRGALCAHHNRTGQLSEAAIKQIKQAIAIG